MNLPRCNLGLVRRCPLCDNGCPFRMFRLQRRRVPNCKWPCQSKPKTIRLSVFSFENYKQRCRSIYVLGSFSQTFCLRPPVNNGHSFCVPMLVVVQRKWALFSLFNKFLFEFNELTRYYHYTTRLAS